jgi:hypothetical protein
MTRLEAACAVRHDLSETAENLDLEHLLVLRNLARALLDQQSGPRFSLTFRSLADDVTVVRRRDS